MRSAEIGSTEELRSSEDAMSGSFDELDKDLGTLEQVSRHYGGESPEGAAMRRAALALMFASLDHAEEFDEFLQRADIDATAAGQEYLASLRARRK